MLFKDDPATGKAARPGPVAPAQRSPSALAKTAAQITTDGQPVPSSHTLLAGHHCRQPDPARRRLPAFTWITSTGRCGHRPLDQQSVRYDQAHPVTAQIHREIRLPRQPAARHSTVRPGALAGA